MAVAAPPRSLQRPPRGPGRLVRGGIEIAHDLKRPAPGNDDPPFDAPPPPPRTGDGGSGGDFDGEASPLGSLPTAVWILVAAVALAVPAGFVAAACVGRGI